MSRFVRLAEGHYINLDLVTDITLPPQTDKRKAKLFFYYSTSDGEGNQINLELNYATEAEAKAELARILPESVQPTSNRFPGIVGDGISPFKPLFENNPSGVSSTE